MVNKFHNPDIVNSAKDVIRGTGSMPSMAMQEPMDGPSTSQKRRKARQKIFNKARTYQQPKGV